MLLLLLKPEGLTESGLGLEQAFQTRYLSDLRADHLARPRHPERDVGGDDWARVR